VAYSPYNADGSCKSQAAVNQDFEGLSGYSMVRLYGVDCNQTATVLAAAKAKNMKVMAGVFDVTPTSTCTNEVQSVISAAQAQNAMDSIDTVVSISSPIDLQSVC
jgi:exo-beta-1,3-glucanase (GH17 family)